MEPLKAQLHRTPDALAIDDGTTRLSYAELHDQARTVAARLQARGVGAGDRVGLSVSRRAGDVAGMLGVLMAGAAYVPLVEGYPEDRLASLSRAAGIRLFAGSGDGARGLAKLGPVIDLGGIEDTGILGGPVVDVVPGMPAYVLFTSGSTGEPKGVQISHGAASAFVSWGRSAFGADELQVVAGCTAFSFDPSVFEIFVTLSSGGVLRILRDALSLSDLGPGPQPTMALAAPSAISELVRAARFPASLRTLMTGGEPLPAALANRVFERTSVQRLVFAYGPTETAVTVMAHELVYPVADPVPIGRPLPAAEVRLVDEQGREVTPGEIGEIRVDGAHVADGYLSAGQLGADTCGFRGFAAGPGGLGRCYRTGDLALERPDGLFEFRGRKDRQLKVRGYRVEPSEVEAAICRHPDVAQALVVVSGNNTASSLVAYVVPVATTVPVPEVRRLIRAVLPEYMVPSRFISLASFPVNASGKVDVAQLLSQDASSVADVVRLRQADPDDVPAIVVSLIGDLLGIQRPLRMSEDFFDDLGGTSLTAMRLLYEIEEVVGTRLPLTVLLRDPSVGGLIRAVEQGATTLHLSVNPHGDRPPLILLHAWLGQVLRYRRLGPYLPASQPLFGFHVGDDQVGRPSNERIEVMAERGIALLHTVRGRGPYIIGGHSTGAFVAYEMARQLHHAGQDVPLVVLLDGPVPQPGWRFWRDQTALNLADLRTRSLQEIPDRVSSFISNRRFAPDDAQRPPQQRAANTLARLNRGNYLAVKNYRPGAYDGDVALLRTAEGTRRAGGHPLLGWDSLVSGRLTSQLISGSHDGIFDEENLPLLGRCFSVLLDRVNATKERKT